MNKNLLKVSLIVVAVLLAVSAVLIFLRTRVKPPQSLTYTNQYTEDIHRASEQLANVSGQGLEQDFQRVTNRIELLKQEGLITDEEYASSISEYVNAYVPAFRTWCDKQFNQSVWPSETLRFMRKRLDEVKRYNAQAGNNSALSPENVTKLNEVDETLKKYYAAWKLKDARIRKSADSRANLSKANQYKRDAYLSKCTALMNSLNNLPSVYQKTHFNYVNSLVRGLSMDNYNSASQVSDWAAKYKNAKSAITDYNSAASSIYHTPTSNFNIDSYFTQAKNGFRRYISEWDPQSIRGPYEQTFGVTIH